MRSKAALRLAAWFLLGSSVVAATAQEDGGRELPDLRSALLRAFRACEDPIAHGFPDHEAVLGELARLATRVGELGPERRSRVEFYLAVRTADVLLRLRRFEAAAAELLPACDAAQASGTWSGGYRADALVLLEQCVPTERFASILDEEADYIASDRILVDAPWLGSQIEYLRAELAFHQGDDAGALDRLQQLVDVALAERSREDAWRAKAVGRLAWEYLVRSDLARAEFYLKELPVAYQRYPRGLVALRRGDFGLAERAGRALLRQGRAVHGNLLLGEALERQGRSAEALEAYRALAEHAESSTDRAIAQRSLGECEIELFATDADPERLVRAESCYLAALAVLDGDGTHAETERLQVLARLGELALRAGRFDEAAERFRASLDVAERARRSLIVDVFGGSWLAEDHLRAVDGLVQLAERGSIGPFEALAATELGKARTLLDWTAEAPRAGGDPELMRAIRSVALTTDPAALDAQLARLEAARRAAGGETSTHAVPLDANALRELAGQGVTILCSWRGAGRIHWFWTDDGGAPLWGSVSDDDRVREAIAAARRAVRDAPQGDPERAEEEAHEALARAGDLLFPQRCRAILGRSRRIVYSPDAALTRLPFEALPVGAGGAPIGIAVPVVRAPSLSLGAVLAARSTDAERVAWIGPDSQPEVEQQFDLPALRFAQRERLLCESAYDGVIEVLRGDAASAEGLAGLLERERFDLVHVHAHAVADPRVPTASLLVLADGPTALPSLCAMPLRGAFVVLSACSSGAGEARSGEGDLGLWGWTCAAGGRGALAALWSVNQQATADLMGVFHAARAAGADEAEALRAARQTLAAASNYAHPHYWAGFVALGGMAKAEARCVVRPMGGRWLVIALVLVGTLGAWIVRSCVGRR